MMSLVVLCMHFCYRVGRKKEFEMKSEKYFLYVLRTNAPTYRCQRVPYPISNFSVVFLTKGKIVKGKHFPAYWLLL